ncbi:hypothetical protein OFO03_02945 [Campylobacter sp. JMF_02 ED1]|uniref:hypothetical protein n=1 Tax=unclassified Campylobacter TaxID=2593542 RepID=UPI0022E9A544|nr:MULTISPECIES: hypothetical protein [unclassified Campylobacter]MDA3049907.1 hypothetical protein [Campylobacter sp. JMF_15 NE4]MDA3050865.1 hypothetical protein [Campylobacter sp. JMF_02 ED1]
MQIINGYAEDVQMSMDGMLYYFKIDGVTFRRDRGGYIEAGDFIVMYAAPYSDGFWRASCIINVTKSWKDTGKMCKNIIDCFYDGIIGTLRQAFMGFAPSFIGIYCITNKENLAIIIGSIIGLILAVFGFIIAFKKGRKEQEIIATVEKIAKKHQSDEIDELIRAQREL